MIRLTQQISMKLENSDKKLRILTLKEVNRHAVKLTRNFQRLILHGERIKQKKKIMVVS